MINILFKTNSYVCEAHPQASILFNIIIIILKEKKSYYKVG